MLRFQFPWAFLLLGLIPLLLWRARRGLRSGTLRFSSLENARLSGPSWRMRMGRLPLALRLLAVVLLVAGLARPQEGKERVRDVSQGVAIEMVVDRSGSMGQELSYEERKLNRLDVVKRVFKEFVLGDGRDLKGRPNDLIGMVSFARYADTVCPLTLSHGALDHFIDAIRIAAQKNEDGTAIGDALALAAARLDTAEEQVKAGRGPSWGENENGSVLPSPSSRKDYKIKGKVVILLTDGQNNAGKRSPEEAARLAREWGIKVYAIGIGGRESFTTIRTPLGAYKVPAGPGVDVATLKIVAEETGGRYWLAESPEKLHEIYTEIDRLEKTEIESTRYMDYSERFLPFALAALLAVCLEQLLLSTLFRRVP